MEAFLAAWAALLVALAVALFVRGRRARRREENRQRRAEELRTLVESGHQPVWTSRLPTTSVPGWSSASTGVHRPMTMEEARLARRRRNGPVYLDDLEPFTEVYARSWTGVNPTIPEAPPPVESGGGGDFGGAGASGAWGEPDVPDTPNTEENP